MSEKRVMLGELELSQHVVTAGSSLLFAWDRCVELSSVIDALRAQGMFAEKSRAEGRTIRQVAQSPAKITARWKRPVCESTSSQYSVKRKAKLEANRVVHRIDGKQVQDPGKGYLISDMAAYLKLSTFQVRRIAKRIGCYERIAGTKFVRPFTRDEAKHIIVYCRLETGKDRADYFLHQCTTM